MKIFNRVLDQTEIEKEYSSIAGVDRSSDKMLIRVGKRTPVSDGKIMPGEYAMGGTGFFTNQGKYSNRQGKYYLSWNDQYLFIGTETPQPVAPIAERTEHDSEVWNDDSMEIWISGKDGVRYQIIYNTKGVVFDSRHVKKADPYWNLKGGKITNSISGKKWISEVQIPLAELGKKPADGDVWKLNIARTFQAEKPRAFVCVSPIRRRYGFSDVERFPEIVFDCAAPVYEISSIGDINKGKVDLSIKAPESSAATFSYATSERVWFKDTFHATNGKIARRQDFAPGGTFTLLLSNKEKTLFQSDYQGELPSAVSVQYIYTDIEKDLLQNVAKNEGGATGSLLLMIPSSVQRW